MKIETWIQTVYSSISLLVRKIRIIAFLTFRFVLQESLSPVASNGTKWYYETVWCELNALSAHHSCIHLTNAGTVVLFHPEVREGCLALQLSAFCPLPLFLQSSIKSWKWKHRIFICREETETNCQSDLPWGVWTASFLLVFFFL